ncbi:alpha-keto acid decarboxylase family protein [Syntrophotalea acetylenica]|uniref:Pyruvate decarboxylase n=1 Tax=Syntrophotalea acetylenica TaxID=29542 RepID=A0A1L3GDE4_SYNAC|nr:thiamine pyrophosphate-binding protein [Syntrophotalea acetylenica]APG23963.1 pyruvate decarboxylase [Syntrophotalea acetylenica]APG44545.1 pyruvate decarboxylase [Syntrophotalea acetylenica]
MKMTIGNFLFMRLQQIGVGHMFGVPGDYNLQLLEQMKEVDGIEFIGTCNELNAAYAADGYARTNGVGALLTTYGVGDLSAVCGIAGSCAEHVPVVFISGVPPLYAMKNRLRVHHSLAEGDFDNIMNCLKEFTVVNTRLTPGNAAEEIDRALIRCWREKMPVYLQVPSNISYLMVDVSDFKLELKLPASDPERLESAARHIAKLLNEAKKPALLIDMDADRSMLVEGLTSVVKKRQVPYAAFRTGKALLSETDPLFLGVYIGEASELSVKEAIGTSDCLIATAPCFVESSPMVSPSGIPITAHVYIRGGDVTVEGEVYEGVTARELVFRLTELVESCPERFEQPTSFTNVPTPQPGASLTQARLWPRMRGFIRPGDVVVADNGTSNISLTDVRLPENTKYISQLIWGSIGYSLPALLGSMMAARDRRHVLFIGDGSFQLTGQELSTILKSELKPIIFLLNNRGYTIERYILGMREAYNDIANWRYSALPAVFAPDIDTFVETVGTEDKLEEVLQKVEGCNCACFIELLLDPEDAPAALKTFGPLTAKLDYGPRGPQRTS